MTKIAARSKILQKTLYVCPKYFTKDGTITNAEGGLDSLKCPVKVSIQIHVHDSWKYPK